MERLRVIKMIDPFNQRPELNNCNNDELEDILRKLIETPYAYKFSDYSTRNNDIIGMIVSRERTLDVKEKELELWEQRLKKREDRIRSSIQYKDLNGEVRKPDQSYREQLLPSSNIDDEDEDEEFKAARMLSEEEYFQNETYRNRQLFEQQEKEREEIEMAMKESKEKERLENEIKEKEKLERTVINGFTLKKLEGRPAEIGDEFIANFASLLKNQKFDEAKIEMDKLPVACIQWIVKQKYGGSQLRQLMVSKNENAYQCFVEA